MLYTVDTSAPARLDWGASGTQRIVQNVIDLINTWRYEVAYDRTMGINPAILDRPADMAASMYTAEIYRLVAEREPRAKVRSVKRKSGDDEGNLRFEVVIEV